jgi:hypothetical protein
MTAVVRSRREFHSAMGSRLGPAEWLATKQSRIAMFADATDSTTQNRDEAARVAEMLVLILS